MFYQGKRFMSGITGKKIGIYILSLLICHNIVSVCHAEKIPNITKLKNLHSDTVLFENHVPQAVICTPDIPEYKDAANELNSQIKNKFGDVLPCVDIKNEAELDKFKGKNIIAIGSMDNSFIFRWLYQNNFINPIVPPFFTCEKIDSFIYTVHDPFGDGRNIILIGGIDLKNTKDRLNGFSNLLKKSGENISLPPVYIPCVPLTDSDRLRIKRHSTSYGKNIPEMIYAAEDEANHYIRYRNNEWAKLYRDNMVWLAENLETISHLYIFRLIKYWNVLEKAPVFSDEDRLKVINLFINTLNSEEGKYYEPLGLKKGFIPGNHPTQSAAGVMLLAAYLDKYYGLQGCKELLRKTKSFFAPFDEPATYGAGDEDWMRFSSVDNMQEIIKVSGKQLDKHPYLSDFLKDTIPVINNFGRNPAYGDVYLNGYSEAKGYFLKGAKTYNDPCFLWMYCYMRMPGTVEQASIPENFTEKGWLPLTLKPEMPDNFLGLNWTLPDNALLIYAGIEKDEREKFFTKASFRGGITPQDDYLLLDGLNILGHTYYDANGVLEYSSLGRSFLVSFDAYYGTPQSAHNVLLASYNGYSEKPELLARRKSWRSYPSGAITRTVMENINSTWERNIIWVKNSFFVVFDKLIAKQEGIHSAVVFWHTIGRKQDIENGIITEFGKENVPDEKVKFQLNCYNADDVSVGQEADPQVPYLFDRYQQAKPPIDDVPRIIHMVKAHKASKMRSGDAFTIGTCFWASSKQRPLKIESKPISPDMLLIQSDNKMSLAVSGSSEIGNLKIDASTALLSETGIILEGGCLIKKGDEIIFSSPEPVNIEWQLDKNVCYVSSSKLPPYMIFSGNKFDLNNSSLQIKADGSSASQVLNIALKEINSLPPPDNKKTFPYLRYSSAKDEEKYQSSGRIEKQFEVLAENKIFSGISCGWNGKLSKDGPPVFIIGEIDGSVSLFDEKLEKKWQFISGGRINSIDAGDINGDANLEIIIASQDCSLYVLDKDGKQRWKWTPPFDKKKSESAYLEWTWPKPFVRKAVAHDVTGKGDVRIFTGAGQNTYSLDKDGKILWSYDNGIMHKPVMHNFVFYDINGDGVDEVIGGTSDMWYEGVMDAIDRKGKKMENFYYRSDLWCSGVKSAICEDIMNAGRASLIYGTRMGNIMVYPDITDPGRSGVNYWSRYLGDKITSLTWLHYKNKFKSIVASAGITEWVVALSCSNKVLWALYLNTEISALASSDDHNSLYAGCKNGMVYLLNGDGIPVADFQADDNIKILLPQNGALLVGTESGKIFLVK